ncbi:MAG: HD-GYP domain-containing protein [Lachnospiraceae bacterium]|nr:HD-GYP domain-containing protein [Lachnospiraceae bacterium]
MFYSIELFGFSIVVMSFVGVVFGITYTIIVVLINFIFCRNILSKIIVLSKEKRQINKAEFYFLTASFILVSITLLASMTWSGGDNDMRLVLNIVFIFTELLMLVTFNTILKDLSYIHEITHQKEEIETAKNEIKTLSVEVMEALAHTIDAKDEYTKGHSIRVAKYSRMIAERMGMSPTECEDIYYMGLLHDLGKIGVPNEIINSPGPLTDEQYAVIKIHPGLGYEILSEIKSRPDLVTGARWHHERYDGKGYPDRKSGEEIPLMARIIAVADSYDAMTSNRSYRKYLPQEKVKSELEKNSGSQFDPEIAGYMIRIIDEDKDYKLHE